MWTTGVQGFDTLPYGKNGVCFDILLVFNGKNMVNMGMLTSKYPR